MNRNRSTTSTLFAFSVLATTIALGQEKTENQRSSADPDDLSARLIRKAASEGEEDLMAGIIRLMNESARKVEIEFDPGPNTQTLQQSIQSKLDEAIKAAASRQRSKGVAPPRNPDRRRMPSAKREPSPGKPPSPAKPPQPGTSETPGPAEPTTKSKEQDPAELHDVRRGWGHLPQREREEIIQGVGEGFLERYRAWVERYYRALQEKDQ